MNVLHLLLNLYHLSKRRGSGTRLTRLTNAQGGPLLLLSAASNVLTFVLTLLAARLLTPTNYGTFMALFGLWSTVAMPTGAVRLVLARWLAVESTGTGFRRQLLRLNWGGGLAGALLIAGAAWWGAGRLELSPLVTVAVALQAWGLGLWAAWRRGQAQARGLFTRFGWAGVLELVARLVVLVVLLTLSGLPTSWVLFAAMGAGGLGIALALPSRLLGGDHAPVPVRQLTSSLGASFGVMLAVGVLTNLDLLWARYALDLTQAGTFAAGTLASRPFILFGAVAGTLVIPKVARGLSKTHLRRWTAYLLVGSLGLAGVAHLLAEPLVTLAFGAEYRVAVAAARLAAWGGALYAPAILLANAALGAGDPKVAVGFTLFTLVLAGVTFGFADSATAYWTTCGVLSLAYTSMATFRMGNLHATQ